MSNVLPSGFNVGTFSTGISSGYTLPSNGVQEIQDNTLPKYLKTFIAVISGAQNTDPYGAEAYFRSNHFSKDEQYVTLKLYVNIMKDRKAWYKKHPTIYTSGPSFGSSTMTESATAATEESMQSALTQSESIFMEGIGIEAGGVTMITRTLPRTNHPEAEQLARDNQSIINSLNTERSIRLTMSRISGDLGPSVRAVIQRGNSGLRGLVRALVNPRRTGSAQQTREANILSNDDFDIELDDFGDEEAVDNLLFEVDLTDQIQLVNTNFAQKVANGLRRRMRRKGDPDPDPDPDGCPPFSFDGDEDDEEGEDSSDSDDDENTPFNNRRDLDPMEIESSPRPQLPRGESMRAFKKIIGAMALLGGSVGAAAATIATATENDEGGLGQLTGSDTIIEDTKQNIRDNWHAGKYWPAELSFNKDLWLNKALDLMDASAIAQLSQMVVDPNSYYLEIDDVYFFQGYAGTKIDDEDARLIFGTLLPDSELLSQFVSYIHVRGLDGKEEYDAEQVKSVVEPVEPEEVVPKPIFYDSEGVIGDIWKTYEGIESDDEIRIAIPKTELKQMLYFPYSNEMLRFNKLSSLLVFLKLYQTKTVTLDQGQYSELQVFSSSNSYVLFYEYIEKLVPFINNGSAPQTSINDNLQGANLASQSRIQYKNIEDIEKSLFWSSLYARRGRNTIKLAKELKEIWDTFSDRVIEYTSEKDPSSMDESQSDHNHVITPDEEAIRKEILSQCNVDLENDVITPNSKDVAGPDFDLDGVVDSVTYKNENDEGGFLRTDDGSVYTFWRNTVGYASLGASALLNPLVDNRMWVVVKLGAESVKGWVTFSFLNPISNVWNSFQGVEVAVGPGQESGWVFLGSLKNTVLYLAYGSVKAAGFVGGLALAHPLAASIIVGVLVGGAFVFTYYKEIKEAGKDTIDYLTDKARSIGSGIGMGVSVLAIGYVVSQVDFSTIGNNKRRRKYYK
jgi:hypothetical protein